MEGEQYSFDINLDFLDSSISEIKHTSNTVQGPGKTALDIEALASRIASVNELAVQLKSTKEEHAKIRKQMQDLNESAMSIRCMYEREKAEKAKYELLTKELKEKCDSAESQLANKTLHFEQLSSRMELYAPNGPFSYNELVLKYNRLAMQLDEEKLLNYKEKVFLQQLQEYIDTKKLSVLPAFKKKNTQKKQVHDYGVQCCLKAETKSLATQSVATETNKILCSKATQYSWYTTTRSTNTPAFTSPQKEMRTQGTQYISSATTRGTCTSTFIKKHSIGTNFPEVIPVSIEQIFKEMICDVSPLSPIMSDGPELVEQEMPRVEKITKSIGTNTGLKNVRKPIDYVPLRIKHSDSRPPSRNMSDHIKNESPIMGMPTMNPFVGVGMNTPLPMQSTVAELWNMLGHTIFALLQNGSAPYNPLHMNMVNDRMRNLSADMSRRMNRQRSGCGSSTPGNDYFENEGVNTSSDYLPTTRSTATSPISFSDLNIGTEYMNHVAFGRTRFVDDIYMQPEASSSAFISTQACGKAKRHSPIEIQKIVLNSSHQKADKSCTKTNPKKLSRVNEILKLFPEHTITSQKRSAIKKLLRTSSREKKMKRKSSEAPPRQEQTQAQVDCSISQEESIQLDSFHQEYTQNLSQLEDDLFCSSDEESNLSDSCQSSYSIPQDTSGNETDDTQICFELNSDNRRDDDFLGLGERRDDIRSDEVFCKPFLPPKRTQLPVVSSPFPLIQNGVGSQLKNEDVTNKRKKSSNRKRRSVRSETHRLNKIYKVDRGESLDRLSNINNANGKQNITSTAHQGLTQLESNGFLVSSSVSNILSAIEPAQSSNSAVYERLSSNLGKSPTLTERNIQSNLGRSPTLTERNIRTDLKIDDKPLNFSMQRKTNVEKSVSALKTQQDKCTFNETAAARIETSLNSKDTDFKRPNCIEIVAPQELLIFSNEFCGKLDAATNSDRVLANSKTISKDSSGIKLRVNTATRNEETSKSAIEEENSQYTTLNSQQNELFNSKPENPGMRAPHDDRITNSPEFFGLPCTFSQQTATRENPFVSESDKQKRSENSDTKSSFSDESNTSQKYQQMTPLKFSDQISLSPTKITDERSLFIETKNAEFKSVESLQKNIAPFPDVLSDSEPDLSIDSPKSPTPPTNTSLDLSLLFKTPDKNTFPSEFKTPNSSNRGNFGLNKLLTISTENLVDHYLQNNTSPGEPKFQVFLDKILDEVALPLSPISVLAPTEDQTSETEDSSPEEYRKQKIKACTSQKRKRKPPATAAIAVKRSARLNAANTKETGRVNTLSVLNMPGIQLGKYTKKKTDLKSSLKAEKDFEPINFSDKVTVPKKVNIIGDIRLGFFKDLMDESDEPTLVIDENPQVEEDFFEKSTEVSVEKGGKSKEFINSHSEMRKYSQFDSETATSSGDNVQSDDRTLQIACETLPAKPYPSYEDPTSPLLPPSADTNFAECPSSPPPVDQEPKEEHIPRAYTEIASELSKPANNSLLSHIIANYNQNHHKMLTEVRLLDNNKQLSQLESIINGYTSGLCLPMDSIRAVDALVALNANERTISQAFIGIVKTIPRPESEVAHPVPEKYLSQTLRKLLSLLLPLHQRLPKLRNHLLACIEQSLFTFAKNVIPLEAVMNLTQFYLAEIADTTARTSPARLFICKCLYFHNKKAIPMIFETLCVYPSVLPKRDDTTYDRSDALISTIQCLLMSTYYDMEKTDLKTRQMFTKLCKFYNYESSKPPRDEVLDNLIAKIRAGRLKNVPYAFALICKRMEQSKAEKFVLGDRLVPLANEYYYTLSETTENDDRIACVLECISFIIKPFNLDANITSYTNLFGRFLNASERRVIQEAALTALLRTIRFGYVHCFNAIYNFKPNYELTGTTKAMLRSFIYKKSFDFLKRLENQAHVLVATKY